MLVMSLPTDSDWTWLRSRTRKANLCSHHSRVAQVAWPRRSSRRISGRLCPTQTATALRDLFRWSLQDGQRYASQLGYVPLPAPVVEKALAAVNGISPGG